MNHPESAIPRTSAPGAREETIADTRLRLRSTPVPPALQGHSMSRRRRLTTQSVHSTDAKISHKWPKKHIKCPHFAHFITSSLLSASSSSYHRRHYHYNSIYTHLSSLNPTSENSFCLSTVHSFPNWRHHYKEMAMSQWVTQMIHDPCGPLYPRPMWPVTHWPNSISELITNVVHCIAASQVLLISRFSLIILQLSQHPVVKTQCAKEAAMESTPHPILLTQLFSS